MLLLNNKKGNSGGWEKSISIHLMLLLNFNLDPTRSPRTQISIHLMLLLNVVGAVDKVTGAVFQYILCCY